MKVFVFLSLLSSTYSAYSFPVSPPIRSFAHQRAQQCISALNKYFAQNNTGKILKYDSKTRLLTIVTTDPQSGRQDVSFYTSMGKVSSSQDRMSCATSSENDRNTLNNEIRTALSNLASSNHNKARRHLRKINYNCSNIIAQLSEEPQNSNPRNRRTLDSDRIFSTGTLR